MNIIELETPAATEKYVAPEGITYKTAVITEYGRTFVGVPCYQIRMDSPVACIQYVLSGSGVIVCDDRIYTVRAGDTFLLCEGENQIYYSQSDNNFERLWINFKGELARELIRIYGLSGARLFSGVDTQKKLDDTISALKGISDFEEYRRESERRVFLLLQHLSEHKAEQSAPDSSVEKIRLYIDRNIKDNLSLENIAERFSFSREHIIRIFRKNYGITPHRYIMQSKIRIAMIMLKSTDRSIEEISDELGFSDQHHFSHQFCRLVGLRPTAYRKNSRK